MNSIPDSVVHHSHIRHPTRTVSKKGQTPKLNFQDGQIVSNRSIQELSV